MGDYKFGHYKVNRNSLIAASKHKGAVLSGQRVPQFATRGRANEFVHREYLGDVKSGPLGSFTTTAYGINPGLPATFPWLSNMASSYEEYQINGMVFEFVSSYSDAVVGEGTSGTLGTVMMATEYNVTKAGFNNQIAMLNHEYSTSGKVSSSFLHPIECDMKENPLKVLFIRHNGTDQPGVAQDPRFTDLGTFYIATSGNQVADDTLGQLWVSYHVSLLKPRMSSPTSNESLPFWAAKFVCGASYENYFGSAEDVKINAASSLPALGLLNQEAAVVSNIDFEFVPVGRYLVFWSAYGTPITLQGDTVGDWPAETTIPGTAGMDYIQLLGNAGSTFGVITWPERTDVITNYDFTYFGGIAFIDVTDAENEDNRLDIGDTSTAKLPVAGQGGDIFYIPVSTDWISPHGVLNTSAVHAALCKMLLRGGRKSHPLIKDGEFMPLKYGKPSVGRKSQKVSRLAPEFERAERKAIASAWSSAVSLDASPAAAAAKPSAPPVGAGASIAGQKWVLVEEKKEQQRRA